ncbi:MAG TPA: phosphoenolpyruvate phosphomutase [Micromonosporaceae bacterium]|nr:phosphoenolpyruvate phosphomutase [Micromonosporaceae bacterium]
MWGNSGRDGAQVIRARLARASDPVLAAGAVNAVAARVAAEAGFEALWMSGLELSASLGLPDSNVLTCRDLSDAVACVRRASALPIVVDIDNGGGTIDGVRRYAEELVHAGATALCLEDSHYPKGNSFRTDRSQHLADESVVLDQIRHIREVGSPDLLVIARTEALIAGESVEVATARAEAYAKAGADAVLMHSRDRTGSQALQIASQWSWATPLVCIPTSFPQISWKELGTAGFSMVIYANQLARASLAAMRAAATEFMDHGAFESTPQQRLSTVEDLIRLADPIATATV